MGLGRASRRGRRLGSIRVGNTLLIKLHDAAHIGPGFAVWGHTVILSDSSRPGVVGGQGQRRVLEAGKLLVEIFGAAINILGGIEDIAHAQVAGRARHQLHEALSAGR